MSKSKVARPKTQGKAAKAPAEVLREAKAAIRHEHENGPELPRPGEVDQELESSVNRSAAARKSIGDIPVPMTLSEVADIIGVNVQPDNFAATALDDLALQLDGVSSMAEDDNSGCYDRWCVIENIVARMKLASRVVAWLETEPAKTAEVQP